MKKIVGFSLIAIAISAVFTATASDVPPENQALVPSSMPSVVYFDLGGAETLRLPSYNKSRFRFRNSISVNGAMMCNSFNPSISMENLLNGLKQGWATTQRNMVNSVKGTVASLPMLAIQHINNGLYEYMQSAMNAAEHQFQLEVASCEKITGDIKDSTYMGDWVKVSGYEELTKFFTGEPGSKSAPASQSADAGEMVKRAERDMGKEGSTWVCKEKRGGKGQLPILMSEVVLASYNRLLGRGNCEGVAPTSSEVNPVYVSYWPRPKDAQNWFIDVFGEIKIRTDPEAQPLDSKPGVGLMSQIDENARDIAENLKELVSEYKEGGTVSINDMRSVSAPGVLMSLEIVEGIANSNDASMFISRIAAEVSAQREITKAFEMRRLMVSGLNIPEVMQNPTAKAHLAEWVSRIGEEIRMVREEIEIRKLLSQSTVPTLLELNTQQIMRAVK